MKYSGVHKKEMIICIIVLPNIHCPLQMHAILPSYVWKYAYESSSIIHIPTCMNQEPAYCLDFRFVICKQAIVLGIRMNNCATNTNYLNIVSYIQLCIK